MNFLKNILKKIMYIYVTKDLNKIGENCVFERKPAIRNPQYITIGSNCYFGQDCRIEAWDKYNGDLFNPHIIIGDNVKINSTCHIGAINSIKIGNNCLIGSHVMIIDHSHGYNIFEEMEIHPSDRQLYSKGSIRIGNYCWICENAVILPNVTIGDGAIIAANTVVTKDVPPYCVFAGNPGKIVKEINRM